LYLDYVARGKIDFEDGKKLNFIVAHVELGEAMTYDGIVDAIIAELKKQIAERQVLLEKCKKAWEFLSRFQVGGVKYDASRPVETGPRLDELTDLYQAAETLTHRRHRLRRPRRQYPIGPPYVFAMDVAVGRPQHESGSASFGITGRHC
jgi:hypothetical protein